jgi:hypothetical protein
VVPFLYQDNSVRSTPPPLSHRPEPSVNPPVWSTIDTFLYQIIPWFCF